MSRSNSAQRQTPLLYCDTTHWPGHNISRFPKEAHPCMSIRIFHLFSGISVCFQILEKKEASHFCFHHRLSSLISSVSLPEKLCHWLHWVQFFKLHVCKYPQKVYSFVSPKCCMCVQNHFMFLCFFFKKYRHLLLQNDPVRVWCSASFHFILTLRWSNWYRHYRLIHGLHTYLGGLTSALKTDFVLFSYCMVLLSMSLLHLPGRHASDSA